MIVVIVIVTIITIIIVTIEDVIIIVIIVNTVDGNSANIQNNQRRNRKRLPSSFLSLVGSVADARPGDPKRNPKIALLIVLGPYSRPLSRGQPRNLTGVQTIMTPAPCAGISVL